jgi:hypothetical protein
MLARARTALLALARTSAVVATRQLLLPCDARASASMAFASLGLDKIRMSCMLSVGGVWRQEISLIIEMPRVV